MDVTGLIGWKARLIVKGNASSRHFPLVVVGGFERVEGARVGTVSQTETRPHLILIDSRGYLSDHPIDLVQFEANPHAEAKP